MHMFGKLEKYVREVSAYFRGVSAYLLLETSFQNFETSSGEKKEYKYYLFGSADRPVGWGSSTRRGGGRKVRPLPRKFVFLGFPREESGMSREFCWDVADWALGVFKKLVQKKVSAHCSVPNWSKEVTACVLYVRHVQMVQGGRGWDSKKTLRNNSLWTVHLSGTFPERP